MSFTITVKEMLVLKKAPSSLDKVTEKEYKSQPDKGRKSEERALKLVVTFVELVDSAWLAPKAGLLDVNLKVDLVVETGGNAIGLQIKTSDAGKAKHDSLAQYHTGPYGYPDCVVAGPHRRGYLVLWDLCEATGLGLNERYKKAVKDANYFKGTVQPKFAFKRWGDIVDLGLAAQCPEGLRFIPDPPPVPPDLDVED